MGKTFSACPHCGAKLSSSEVGTLYSSLRVKRTGGRKGGRPIGEHRTVRAWELLEFIRAEVSLTGPITPALLMPKAEKFVAQKSLGWRKWAFSFVFTALTNEGILKRVQHGVYISERVTPIASGDAQHIVEKWEFASRKKTAQNKIAFGGPQYAL